MANTFLEILSAYLLGDLARQLLMEIDGVKRNRLMAVGQPVSSALLAALFIGQWHWPIIAAVFATSLLINLARELPCSEDFWFFAADKALHLMAIAMLAVALFPTAVADGRWITALQPDTWNWACQGLVLVSGLILCVPLGGALLGKAMTPLTAQIDKKKIDGLTNGGRYIGWLERLLIFLFILMGSLEGVGFLLGAKSILRFGEIKEQEDRKVTEYIIIGTFFSFGWGILAAELTRRALELWSSSQ